LRDYVDVRDVARANITVLEDERARGVINVGSPDAVSVLDYARRMASLLGRNIEPIVPGMYRVGDTRHSLSDTGQLRRLGWTREFHLQQTMADFLGWAETQLGSTATVADADYELRRQGTLRQAAARQFGVRFFRSLRSACMMISS
jgi:dTDP-L-rhamnose 4-epimerase